MIASNGFFQIKRACWLALVTLTIGIATSTRAEPISLECRYVNEDRSPDWIALVQFDSEAGDASLTGYPITYANQASFHRVIDRLPVDRTPGEVRVRRADSEKTYHIDRRTLESRTVRKRVSEVGTTETLTQFGKCKILNNEVGNRRF